MKSVTAKDNKGNNSSGIFYSMYVLSMLLFGTNGYLVSHISLQSSQIVLVRTLIGGILLSAMVLFSSMQRLPAQSVALISYIDPVSALLFSAWLLNENMTLLQIAGAVFIIGGAILGELGD